MKKNKKFVRVASACAAALLTLAPVVTPTTSVFAAEATNNSNTDTNSNSALKIKTDNLKKAGTVAGLMTVPNIDMLNLTDNNGLTVNHIDDAATVYDNMNDAKDAVQNKDTKAALASDTKLTGDRDYYRVVNVVLNAPDKTQSYKIDNGIEEKEYKPDDNGTITVSLVQKVHVDKPEADNSDSNNNQSKSNQDNNDQQTNTDDNTQSDKKTNNSTITDTPVTPPAPKTNVQDQTPYFVNAQGTIFQNGSLVNAPVSNNLPADSVKNITTIINGMGLRTYVGNDEDNFLEPVTENDVKKQLEAENIKPNDKGQITIPNSGFTYQLTAEKNGQKAGLQIFFKGPGSVYDAYPILKFNNQDVMQGMNNFSQQPVVLVDLNDKDWEDKVLKQFVAQETTDNKTKINLSKDNLTVPEMNIKQPGLYQATLAVTNGDKKQTILHFFIGVKGSYKDIQDTRLVLGDSKDTTVNTYSIDNNKVTKLGTATVGQRLIVYPNDTQTIDNTSYTRVVINGKKREDTNVWMKTEDLGKQMPVDERGKSVKLMHAAYLYDKLGKRVGDSIIGSYSHMSVVDQKVKIGNRYFYRIANSNNYIAAGNVDYTPRTLKKTAYLWHNNGKHYTRHGHNLIVKKGARIKTWGARFNIKGKAYYRVAYGKYVLVSDFE